MYVSMYVRLGLADTAERSLNERGYPRRLVHHLAFESDDYPCLDTECKKQQLNHRATRPNMTKRSTIAACRKAGHVKRTLSTVPRYIVLHPSYAVVLYTKLHFRLGVQTCGHVSLGNNSHPVGRTRLYADAS